MRVKALCRVRFATIPIRTLPYRTVTVPYRIVSVIASYNTSDLNAASTTSPHVVKSFSSCLGAPRHGGNDPDFVVVALTCLGPKPDRLLALVKEVAEEDPFVALHLLHVCNVNMFGHVISVVPPDPVRDFAHGMNLAISSTFGCIQHEPLELESKQT